MRVGLFWVAQAICWRNPMPVGGCWGLDWDLADWGLAFAMMIFLRGWLPTSMELVLASSH